jgi:hypothetical protein
MIHHISFAVNNPLHVAQVVAELWQGQVIPFPEHSGSYIALKLDRYGTAIEFLPKGTVLKPGSSMEPSQFSDPNPVAFGYTATHVNIALPISEAQIYEIADREGWRAVRCQRGDFFELIEFWVENEIMLELIPPSLIDRYLATMHPENLQALFNSADQ